MVKIGGFNMSDLTRVHLAEYRTQKWKSMSKSELIDWLHFAFSIADDYLKLIELNQNINVKS